MSTSKASGAAPDAKVETVDNATEDTEALRRHRALLANEAEAGVKATERTIREIEASVDARDKAGVKAARLRIRDLKASLKDREAEAKRLRAEAKES